MGRRLARLAATLTGVPWLPDEVDAGDAGEAAARPAALGVMPRSTLGVLSVPEVGTTKATVLGLPTLQRAHDLIVSCVAGLTIVPYRETWDPAALEVTRRPIEPLPWHRTPDTARTRAAFLGGLASDLWAYQVAYARIVTRYVIDGRPVWPASFQWMPRDYVAVTLPAGAVPELGLVPGSRIEFAGAEVPYADVLEFRVATTGVCSVAWGTIETAKALDGAAARFANAEVPAGWLQQVAGEPMGAEDLSRLGADFTAARRSNVTAALNNLLEYHESTQDPDRLQLVEGRQYQALELARVGNVPAYMVGAPAGSGMTYQNAQQAKADLVTFGAAPIIAALEQTLSGPRVSPTGQGVYLDLQGWVAETDPGAPADDDPAGDAGADTPEGDRAATGS